MMDFLDALLPKHEARLTVTDGLALMAALAEARKQDEYLSAGWLGAIEWWQRTGEVLPGCEIEVVEAGGWRGEARSP